MYRTAKELLRQNSDEYDPEKAITLLTVSAEQGLSLAQYRLGKMLLLGTDTEPSPEDGVYWLEQAANQGNEWAQYLLGRLYLFGQETEQDIPYIIFNTSVLGMQHKRWFLLYMYLNTTDYF